MNRKDNYYFVHKATRRERLKSALYLRLKKRKKLFFGKKLDFFEFFLLTYINIMLTYINIYSFAKYQKTRKGDSFDTLKNFQKKSQSAEKKWKGGPFCLVRFCRLR